MISGRSVKCMMVGDTGVGKTSAVEVFTKKNKAPYKEPTSNLVTYKTQMSINNEAISLEIWDTPGEHEFTSLRKECYPLTDVVLLVFNMCDRKSLDSVKSKLFI